MLLLDLCLMKNGKGIIGIYNEINFEPEVKFDRRFNNIFFVGFCESLWAIVSNKYPFSLLTKNRYSFKKDPHFQPLFISSSFQYSKHSISIFADVCIRTTDLWSRKRPLYQLSHNHCPRADST